MSLDDIDYCPASLTGDQPPSEAEVQVCATVNIGGTMPPMEDAGRSHCLNPDACTAAKPTTHCRRCNRVAQNKTAEMRAISSATAKRLSNFRSPEARAAAHNDPVINARRAERMRLRHSMLTFQQRSEKMRAIWAERMAWCPDRFRALYQQLVHTRHFKMAEARRIIEGEIQAEARREIAAVTAKMRAKYEREKREAY